MARTSPPTQIARQILDRPVQVEMQDSFVPYALSVTTARAIPDVRDGLKPVQRRILYAMDDIGLRPDAARKKSASVVGDVMAKYHPHGDGAIYEALVRLGQDFAMSVPLIDPQGNFGSLDDPPAAHRYTEARLATSAMRLIGEIDEDTVDHRPTFTGERDEPVVLPAVLPNLLVNGASGIAVGMATNLPPHNLVEVASAIELVMTKRRPRPSVDELMQLVPGPDFPAGGIVIDDGSLRAAYETGRGTIRVRARATIEPATARRSFIVVTELPYLVGPERVVARIGELVKAGRLAGVSDVKNLTDRHNGMRLVIECRADVDPRAVLGELYRLTPLEESFGINNVALVDGVPTTLGLYDMCRHYVEHRLAVVVRRTRFRLDRARAREHIVAGLLVALDAIDSVVTVIRSSADVAEAKDRLMAELDLSETQASHILDMQLRRLTALEIDKLRQELAELRQQIADYEAILSSERRQRRIVLDELRAVAAELGTPRRSEIVPADEIVSYAPLDDNQGATLELAEAGCVIGLSSSGLLGRQRAGEAFAAKPGRHDLMVASVAATTRSRLHAITDRGRLLAVAAAQVPEVAGRSRGAAATEMFGLARGERIVGLADGDDGPVLLATRAGTLKRLAADVLRSCRDGSSVISLKGRDRVAAAMAAPEGTEVVLVASDGQAVRIPAAGVPMQGTGAAGVAGMKLRSGAHVVAAGAVEFGTVLAVVTDEGTLKVTDAAEVPTTTRNTGGVRLLRFRGFETVVSYAWVGPDGRVAAQVSPSDDSTAGAGGDAARADAAPEPLDLVPTRRGGTSHATPRRIIALGTHRAAADRH
jgi:DNA gyrase subunit A